MRSVARSQTLSPESDEPWKRARHKTVSHQALAMEEENVGLSQFDGLAGLARVSPVCARAWRLHGLRHALQLSGAVASCLPVACRKTHRRVGSGRWNGHGCAYSGAAS